MTLKNLYKNKCINYTLKQNTWMIGLSVILHGFSTLMPMIIQVIDKLQTGRVPIAQYILLENVVSYMAAIIGATVVAIAMFKGLNSKSEVDCYHSVPIKKSSLFCSRYMTGVTAYLTGIKFTYFATTIIGFVIGVFTISDLWNLFLSLVSIILVFLSTYAFLVMGVVATDNVLIAVCTAYGIMFSPVAVLSIGTIICDRNYQSMSYKSIEAVVSFGQKLAPPLVAINSVLGIGTTILEGIAYMALIWIVVTLLAYIIFTKRSSEAGSKC